MEKEPSGLTVNSKFPGVEIERIGAESGFLVISASPTARRETTASDWSTSLVEARIYGRLQDPC